jgi:hypothetical protein
MLPSASRMKHDANARPGAKGMRARILFSSLVLRASGQE